jgi:dTDP-4-dehydrorhamnose reductase
VKFLIVGNGQLGSEFERLLKKRSNDEFVLHDKKTLDITNRENVEKVIGAYQPDWILDAAAYTAVDKAEDEGKEVNWLVNETGTQNLVEVAKKNNSKLVYVSTDYVFDGTNKNEISENDSVNPQNEYGKAKLAGEQIVSKSGIDFYTIRTSWVFGEFGNNFVFTMQKLAQTHPELNVVNDQTGRPTWAKNLAEFIFYLIDNHSAFGTYHFSNDGVATWFDFASEILKNEDVKINPVDSSAFAQKAYRPKYSVMSLAKAKGTGFIIPNWQNALQQFLNEIKQNND